MSDRKPQPQDGPDYHAELAAWSRRHRASKCECYMVVDPWQWHGVTEPGGAMEQNPDCPIHPADEATQ